MIAKLYSYRPTDIQNIISEGVLKAVDWERLDYLATSEDEAMASALNSFRYREFRTSYEQYVERWKP